jgi:alpha-tubulin suppressor-like RCC1 family protein
MTERETKYRVNWRTRHAAVLFVSLALFCLCQAARAQGTVAWGYNADGQLGNGTFTRTDTPVQVIGLTGVTTIAAGNHHSLALKSDGTVWAWGQNLFGQLGNGTFTTLTITTPYDGINTPVQATGLTGVTAIAAGVQHSLALKNDGTVWAWGYNFYGQLGNGTFTTIDPSGVNTPVQVTGLTGVKAVAAGGYHSLALKNDGTVWAWGYNLYGQLGNGTYTNTSPFGIVTPVQVIGLTGVTAIAGGGYNSLALNSDGTVWVWGGNDQGQLGNGTYTTTKPFGIDTPVQVIGLTGVTAIAGGFGQILALKSDSTVWDWGSNLDGELGIGTYTTTSPPGINTPVQVIGLTGVTAIAAGGGQSLALQNTSPTGCTYSLTAGSASFGVGPSIGMAGVVAGASCTWNVSGPLPAWLTITSGDSGSGNGTVNYSLLANSGSSLRSAILTIAGQVFTVSQSGQSTSDFDLSGHADVLWQDPVTGLAQIWFLGGGEGTSVLGAANLTSSNTGRIVGVGDFNRDGHPDVVWQDPVTGAAQVWFLGGTQGNELTGASVLSEGNPWRIVSVADFNGDGQPDVLWQDPISGLAQIWLLGGAQGTTIMGAANLTASNPWRIVGTGDFNSDGHPDVLWQDPVSGAVQVWYLGGAQGNMVMNAVTLTGSNSWRIAAIADFNEDGHPDVVWQDPVSGAVQVWFLGGVQGTTISGSASLSGPNIWRIVGPH